MKILAAETSGKAASVCITEDDRLIFETYSDCGLTHGKELVPSIKYALEKTGLKPDDIDLFAVSAGPGSFTGIRIGISAIKALAWCAGKPCAAVSSLEAAAYSAASVRGRVICSLTDARGGRMYNALFESDGQRLKRLCDDRVILLSELINHMKNDGKLYFLVGDGAKMCYTEAGAFEINAELATANMLLPRAYGVAMAGLAMHEDGRTVTSGELLPSYLVLCQAERERMERMKTSGGQD